MKQNFHKAALWGSAIRQLRPGRQCSLAPTAPALNTAESGCPASARSRPGSSGLPFGSVLARVELVMPVFGAVLNELPAGRRSTRTDVSARAGLGTC